MALMDAAARRKLYRQDLDQRHKDAYAAKDDQGSFHDMFEPTKKNGVKFWKPKEGEHDIFIVPSVSGEQHPKYDPNRGVFTLDVFVHRQIGLNKDTVVCLNKTYRGEKCPICEYQARLREMEDADEEAVKALNATKRSLYNVVVCDNPTEENKGVQVWDVSQWLFTKPLEDFAHKKREGGEVKYADLDKGKIISFVQKGSKRSLEFTAFEFKDRREITDEELDTAVCLDELIHKPTYEEVDTMFKSGLTDNNERETKEEPKKEEPRRESRREESRREEPKEEPKKEEPREERRREEPKDIPEPEELPKSSSECPYGAVFGKDFNEYEECRDCAERSACRTKNDELSAPKQEKKRLTRRER